MDPLPVVSINYSNETQGPWPRILKILAVVAIVFGAMKAGATLLNIKSMWNLPPGVARSPQFSIYWLSWGLEIFLDLAIAVGGLRLLMRAAHYRPLMLAAWIWCAVTIVGLVLQLVVRFIPEMKLEYVAASMLYGAIQAVFPVVIILFLSEYRKSQQIAPQQQVPPAFQRWPGQS